MLTSDFFTEGLNAPRSPYDIGGADAWYHRGNHPEQFNSPEDRAEYLRGYEEEGVSGRNQGKQYEAAGNELTGVMSIGKKMIELNKLYTQATQLKDPVLAAKIKEKLIFLAKHKDQIERMRQQIPEVTQRTDEIFADQQQENHGNGITSDQLEVNDDVIITGPVEFNGATGIIDSFGRDKRFVVVNLYNHGKHSFHSSDVEGNDYQDLDEEEEYLRGAVSEAGAAARTIAYDDWSSKSPDQQEQLMARYPELKVVGAPKIRKARVSKPKAEPVSLLGVMLDIDAAIGQGYPDVEPTEYLARNPKYVDQYGQLNMDLLDRAVRKVAGDRDLHDYVTKVYQEYDRGGYLGTGNMREQAGAGNDSYKPYGVRYRVFVGREGRVATKEAWFKTSQAMERGIEKLQNVDGFYEIVAYSLPDQEQGVTEDPITGAAVGGLIGLALGAKGAWNAGRKANERGYDLEVSTPKAGARYVRDFAQGIIDPRTYIPRKKKQDVAEGFDIGQEWMSDTELDQYVPERLQQQWRELLGYDENGNPSALWANLTGGYEPDVNDPQHRRLMVKVANKWFAAKKIPNVKFFDVKDADDELEWLVQIGEQGMAEGLSQTPFTDEELVAINQYLDDDLSFQELKTYPGLIRKIATHFDITSIRGHSGEMNFYDRLVQAREEGDILQQGVAEGLGKPLMRGAPKHLDLSKAPTVMTNHLFDKLYTDNNGPAFEVDTKFSLKKNPRFKNSVVLVGDKSSRRHPTWEQPWFYQGAGNREEAQELKQMAQELNLLVQMNGGKPLVQRGKLTPSAQLRKDQADWRADDRGDPDLRETQQGVAENVAGDVNSKKRYHFLYPHVPLDMHTDHEYNDLSDRDLQAVKSHQRELADNLGKPGAEKQSDIASYIQINRARSEYDQEQAHRRKVLDAEKIKRQARDAKRQQGVAEGLQNIEIQDDKSIVTISVGGKERFVLQPATGHKLKSYGGRAYKYWTIYDIERKKDRFNPNIGMMSKNQAIAYVNKIIKHEEDTAKEKQGVAEGSAQTYTVLAWKNSTNDSPDVEELDIEAGQARAMAQELKAEGYKVVKIQKQDMAEGSKDLTKELVRRIEKSSGGKDTAKRDAKGILQLVKNTNKKKGVAEELSDASPITGAITRRILKQRLDLLKQYGPELVGAAIDNVADYVGDVDEIGSSDVSAWVAQVERMLQDTPPEAFAEGFDKIQEVKKFRTTYGWAGGSKEPRSAHAKQVAAKRKEYEKGLGKFEPTDDMVGTAKMIKDIATSNASPEHKKAAIDALNKKGVAEAKADPLGAWIAHKNGTEARRFKTREGAKKYAASHEGFTVNSSEGFHDTYRKKKDVAVDEGRWFRTSYGWAGGRNEKTGKMYKHPELYKKAQEKQAKRDADTGEYRDMASNVIDKRKKGQGLAGIKSQGRHGVVAATHTPLPESDVNEGKLYYGVVGTTDASLRKDFGMRKDATGWYLSEDADKNKLLEAQRAFGKPLS